MHPPYKPPPDQSKVPTVDEVQAPTRMVQPHKDYSVIDPPNRKTSSASMLAVRTPPNGSERVSEGIRGKMVASELEAGTIIIRLEGASASMKALMQLAASQGAEIELVIRAR